ncbi:hypothetical protein IG631_23516 [Alternaria alternata]|nr:hypothetical protein IG631_23516 [Alternaria alternata]
MSCRFQHGGLNSVAQVDGDTMVHVAAPSAVSNDTTVGYGLITESNAKASPLLRLQRELHKKIDSCAPAGCWMAPIQPVWSSIPDDCKKK